ncbi:MAG: hypothetical protein AB8D78_12785 [Akkermansiaceae bacterium]
MTFRNFILGLSGSFGVAWLAIIVVPYFNMRSIEPLSMGDDAEGTSAVYVPKRAGRIADGSEVYAANGCYLCHSQLVRPTYAGNDLYRSDAGGFIYDDDRGDTRRESNVFDYEGESFAHIGVARNGPDLSNLAVRVREIYAKDAEISAEQWLYRHLYSPRLDPMLANSTCPSFRFLFDEIDAVSQPSDDGLPFQGDDGEEIVPSPDAKALISYLLSLKKDQPVPLSLDFSPEDTAAEPTQPAAGSSAGGGDSADTDTESTTEASAETPAP